MVAEQITATGDVGRVVVASNLDGSVRWYVYERPQPGGGGLTIYVQREAGGVRAAEVQLLAAGSNPRVYFDANNAEFIVLYDLQENVFMVRYNENDVPTTEPPQIGDTAVDHYSAFIGTPETKTFAQTGAKQVIGIAISDAYNGPPAVAGVAIGAATTVGKVQARVAPNSTQFADNVVGFRIHRRSATGGFTEVVLDAGPNVNTTDNYIEFQGLSTLHVAEFTFVPGVYYATQVNRKGSAGTQLVQARKFPPADDVLGALTVISAVMQPVMGAGFNLVTDRVDRAPVTISRGDTFPSAQLGEGRNFVFANPTITQPIVIPSPADTFPSAQLGEGRLLQITRTGTGSVIIG